MTVALLNSRGSAARRVVDRRVALRVAVDNPRGAVRLAGSLPAPTIACHAPGRPLLGAHWVTLGYMAEALDARINTRVPQRVKDDLTAVSRRRRLEESELARTLLDEALRREKHPGIVFRTTPTGREAAIEGRRLYVWQIIETVRASEGGEQEAADSLGLRPEQVRNAVDYYAEYDAEIDRLIVLTYEDADRARQLSERRQQALHP
jgi:uncharacterized protein (DUF433 family)